MSSNFEQIFIKVQEEKKSIWIVLSEIEYIVEDDGEKCEIVLKRGTGFKINESAESFMKRIGSVMARGVQ